MVNVIHAVFHLAKTFALVSLLVCGSAQAALSSFEGYAVASDDELDNMRGGFEVNWNGMQFLLAFSIEKLSYTNGVLVAHTSFNLLDLLKGGSPANAVTDKLATPGKDSTANSPELLKNLAQVDSAFSTNVAPPTRSDPESPAPGAKGSDQTLAPLINVAVAPVAPGKMTISNPPARLSDLASIDTQQEPKLNPENTDLAPPEIKSTEVVTTLSTSVTPPLNAPPIQLVNGVALNANVLQGMNSTMLNSYLSNLIQNTVNGEVLRNITILNATINARVLSASHELNATLNRGH